jgi:site-specific recombinase XerD
MNQQIGEPRQADGWLAHVAAYKETLVEQGYAESTIGQRVRMVSRLAERLEQQGLSIGALNEQRIDECETRNDAERSALRWFLCHLRQCGLVAHPVRERGGPIEGISSTYEDYLLKERGVCRGSADSYLLIVRRFLRERFGDGEVLALGEIVATDLSGFMRRQACQYSVERAKVMATALRSFLGFLRWRGDVRTDLAAAVPGVAYWRLSTLPRWITRQEVDRVLASCQRQSAIGRRNYAMVLLLARLGLRAVEVAELKLEDLNWRAGEISVAGKKGGCDQKLPLTQEVGKALAQYLRHDRPRANTRHVFVRSRAPRRGMRGQAISTIVHKAMRHAGIELPRAGAHTLRHSLATEMLRNGASLAEIAEVLRHKHIDTTAIYAKVDVEGLRTQATPWPGGES